MGTILLLACAAAVYPQLLAVVVVILTRPNPRPLLWACYLGCLTVSIASSVVIIVIFESRGSIAGTSSRRLGPAVYLAIGAVALLLAILMATRRGRELLDRGRPVPPLPPGRFRPGSATAAKTRARADRALREGSLAVACLVGALLAIPGPFDLLAVSRLARDGDGVIAAAVVMVVFALIKFALIEVPLAGYTFDPDGTAARVGRFSRWMHANKLVVLAATVGLIGVLLIGRGISGIR